MTLKFTVSGAGNIQLIDKLTATFPPDFEVYDPKVTSDISTTASGVSREPGCSSTSSSRGNPANSPSSRSRSPTTTLRKGNM
ncbi:MAG: BatD family protein [Marinilabiliales bacterium]|nr:BatD family protein [Marinilabiliales bacterium]